MVDEIKYESALGKSDHSVINVDFRCYVEVCDTKVMKYYYDRGDYVSMKSKLENVIWNDVPSGCIFKVYLKSLEEEFIPYRLVTTINGCKGKFPRDKELLKKNKEKAHLVEVIYGNERRRNVQ